MTARRNHTGHRIGECHHRARLTDDQVRQIREQAAQGLGYKRLAKLHGCAESTARDIVTYRTRPL
jgi:hypothetical protein